MSEPWIPMEHMSRGVKFLLSRAVGALWYDPGLSKTAISLATIKVLRNEKLMRGALVVAPLHPLYNSWPSEIEKWLEFNDLKYTLLHGKKKLDNLFGPQQDVYLINPEGLQWLFAQLNGEEWPFDVLFIDESTRFKHTNTQRFKTLRAHINKFRRRYELTGTPAPNGLEDIFGQILLLDGGLALGRYITHYRMTYFNQGGYGGYTYTLKPDAAPKIYKRLGELVLRMDEKDWIKLPPLIIAGSLPRPKAEKHMRALWVDLPEEAMKVYKKLDHDLIVSIREGKVTAANGAVASMKCQQVANGAIYMDEDYERGGKQRAVGQIHDAKLDALKDLVEELQGTPLLVVYWFEHDLMRLQKAFPQGVTMGGDPKKVKRIVDEWNRGEHTVVFMQPSSTAWGLNLQEVHAAIALFSQFWDLEMYDQIIRRLRRTGYKGKNVVLHRIAARNTIDEAMIDSYNSKGKTQGRLMNALKKYAERNHG